MPPVTRRTLLQATGVAIAAGLAGCNESSGQQPAPTPQLGDLTITNHDQVPHTVHAILLKDDTPVYWKSKHIPAANDGVSSLQLEDFPTDPYEYVLHVRTDSRGKDNWAQFDFSNHDTGCLGIKIVVGDQDQSNRGNVAIWKTTDSTVCQDTTTPQE